MKASNQYPFIGAVLGAAVCILAGCAGAGRIASTSVARQIGTVERNGIEVPVFDSPLVRDTSARPVYPPAARREGIQGFAVVRIFVDETGKAADGTIVASSPIAEFGPAALTAAKRSKYVQMNGADGRPVAYVVERTFRFAIGDQGQQGRPMALDGAGWNGL